MSAVGALPLVSRTEFGMIRSKILACKCAEFMFAWFPFSGCKRAGCLVVSNVTWPMRVFILSLLCDP